MQPWPHPGRPTPCHISPHNASWPTNTTHSAAPSLRRLPGPLAQHPSPLPGKRPAAPCTGPPSQMLGSQFDGLKLPSLIPPNPALFSAPAPTGGSRPLAVTAPPMRTHGIPTRFASACDYAGVMTGALAEEVSLRVAEEMQPFLQAAAGVLSAQGQQQQQVDSAASGQGWHGGSRSGSAGARGVACAPSFSKASAGLVPQNWPAGTQSTKGPLGNIGPAGWRWGSCSLARTHASSPPQQLAHQLEAACKQARVPYFASATLTVCAAFVERHRGRQAAWRSRGRKRGRPVRGPSGSNSGAAEGEEGQEEEEEDEDEEGRGAQQGPQRQRRMFLTVPSVYGRLREFMRHDVWWVLAPSEPQHRLHATMRQVHPNSCASLPPGSAS